MLATMGNGLPYSVAAAIAYPGRQVVCMSGDGGFTMMMAELLTHGEIQAPGQSDRLQKQLRLGKSNGSKWSSRATPQFGVDLQPLDFALYAQACGAGGFTLDDPDRAEEILGQAFAHPGPAVVQAVVDPNEPALPGHVTMDQAWKFAESMVRGEKNRWGILKSVVKQKIREVV